jgi:hypothetical protein
MSTRRFFSIRLKSSTEVPPPQSDVDTEMKEPEPEDLGKKQSKKISLLDIEENLSKILHRRSTRRPKLG